MFQWQGWTGLIAFMMVDGLWYSSHIQWKTLFLSAYHVSNPTDSNLRTLSVEQETACGDVGLLFHLLCLFSVDNRHWVLLDFRYGLYLLLHEKLLFSGLIIIIICFRNSGADSPIRWQVLLTPQSSSWIFQILDSNAVIWMSSLRSGNPPRILEV